MSERSIWWLPAGSGQPYVKSISPQWSAPGPPESRTMSEDHEMERRRMRETERRLTAPLRICIAGTAVNYLEIDGIRVSVFTNRVVRAVGLGADQLKTLAAGQVVVPVSDL